MIAEVEQITSKNQSPTSGFSGGEFDTDLVNTALSDMLTRCLPAEIEVISLLPEWSPKTTERVAEARLPTEFGEFRILGFRSLVSAEEFVVLVKGELRPDRASPVRIHSQCMTGDVFGSLRCECGRQLDEAMKIIEREGHGVIVYQQQEGRGIGIINKIRAYALQDEGADTIEANELLGFEADMRCYKQCAEILLELGLRAVRVMSDNPAKLRALRQGGLEIVERVRLEIEPHDFFAGYLKTKKEKMGHLVSVA